MKTCAAHWLTRRFMEKPGAQVMQEAAKLGIKKVWMQPGSDSKEAVKIAKDAGMSVIHGGPCVLVQLR